MSAVPTFSIHLMSGGLDSTVLLYDLIEQGLKIHCLLFDYGQRHSVELHYARRHCSLLDVPHTHIELHRIRHLFKHSALTDGEGSHIVPNRNAVFLHIAGGIGASIGANIVTIGCNKDDQADFPDCRWDFIESVNASLKAAQIQVEICAPYIGLTKRQIVRRAKEKGWPYEDTVSCYTGNNCGTCSACKKRIAATLNNEAVPTN